jgi:D-glycerate 3-kinase
MPWCLKPSNSAPEHAVRPAIDQQLLQGLALPLLHELERSCTSAAAARPVLALTAPVGAGKSTLARQLQQLAAARGIRLAVASIDDAYRPWPERAQLLAGNPFGVNRVPPGSHEPALLVEAIADWRQSGVLNLPRFDKTLRQGHGDRLAPVAQQADALLLEGWLVGYEPCGIDRINAWLAAQQHSASSAAAAALSAAEQAWLPHWDQALADYQELWGCCASFWVLQPADWSAVLRWRLQAEARQRRTSGKAMDAAAIRGLVRATIASLPPDLYQPDLLSKARVVATLDQRRRCVLIRPQRRLR